MGRSIYADEVGSNKGDAWVHKFWVAVQPSDVSDYLDAYEPQYSVADLDVEKENEVKATIANLKAEFKKVYNTDYDSFMNSDELNAFADYVTLEGKALHAKQVLAARINLGMHLLETIANMKVAGITYQQLTIEC